MPTDTTQKPSASNWGSSRSFDRRRPVGPEGLERRAGRAIRRYVGGALRAPTLLVVKLIWAGLFPVLLLAAIVATGLWWPDAAGLARYDALVLYALGVQVVFLSIRLETWREAAVILVFHLLGTGLELYKTGHGAWVYPEPGALKLATVPLFSGFMYAAVGSFLARAIRVFHLRFEGFPPLWAVLPVVLAIYVNFFTLHVWADLRWALFAATVAVFWRTTMVFRVDNRDRRMPLACAALCLAVPLWVAETIGTVTGTWIYADHAPGAVAPYATLGSWYLLLYVSFMLVLGVNRRAVNGRAFRWT